MNFEPMDRMIAENLWICPIKPQNQDNAYYSISKNEIVVPEKAQFKDGESFYGTLFHEMTHSTGAADVLGRIKSSSFGSAEYAREELVAELGAALVAQRYGMTKNLKDDSAAYLKSWLDSLRESPSFIKTTLVDVKKATSLITQRIDKIALNQTQDLADSQSKDLAKGQSETQSQRQGKGNEAVKTLEGMEQPKQQDEQPEAVESEAYAARRAFHR